MNVTRIRSELKLPDLKEGATNRFKSLRGLTPEQAETFKSAYSALSQVTLVASPDSDSIDSKIQRGRS